MSQIVLFLFLFFVWAFALAQGTEPQPSQAPQVQQVVQPPQQPQKRFLIFFKKDEAKEKYQKEKGELYKKYQKERKEAREQHLKQRKEEIEKRKKERKEKRKKREAEKNISSAIKDKGWENKKLAMTLIKEREEEIKTVHKAKRHVEIITNESDPLYITKADVLDAKTSFLKIKEVEIKYKLEIHNQTPKIINSVLVIWERKIPFLESQTVIKETKISKPIIPYEKRVVEYNDLDSKREGEIYTVKIANIIFEDGTQWKNPS